MICIARPSVSSMGYWATDTFVECRVCEVDARRRMGGASKKIEAIWNDGAFSILMLAGGDAHLAPQGQAASPPRPQGSKAPKAPSPQACKPQFPSAQAPESPKSPSRQVPERPSPWRLRACPPSTQFSNFQIARSASARPQIHRKRPNSKFRSPKFPNSATPEPRSNQNRAPFELRVSNIPQTYVGPAQSPSPRPPKPPSTPAPAPSDPKRRTPTPCSWGGCSSTPSQRHCRPAG